MRLSRVRLQREATATGFRVEILEKVAQLLDLLEGFNRHPYLKGRLALKGGTALCSSSMCRACRSTSI